MLLPPVRAIFLHNPASVEALIAIGYIAYCQVTTVQPVSRISSSAGWSSLLDIKSTI